MRAPLAFLLLTMCLFTAHSALVVNNKGRNRMDQSVFNTVNAAIDKGCSAYTTFVNSPGMRRDGWKYNMLGPLNWIFGEFISALNGHFGHDPYAWEVTTKSGNETATWDNFQRQREYKRDGPEQMYQAVCNNKFHVTVKVVRVSYDSK
ncbi:uncharacterized protein LOC129596068 isoform X2 [Paramacrobiotus metropolitanus]|nr:uncharacterized protein LOC129596068 isoform X2 [Paramacrobiotus metropolitanus]